MQGALAYSRRICLTLLVCGPASFAATALADGDSDNDLVVRGEALYQKHCAVCHGEKGLGDGITAEALEIKPADLTEGHVQELSDGALFYIITHGKPETPMPAWEGILEEEDRWNIVNFMRTLVGEHEDGDHMEDDHMEDDHGEEEHMEEEHSD